MGDSFVHEVLAPFKEVFTLLPIVDCLERWLFTALFVMMVFGLVCTIDTLLDRRYYFTSLYVDFLRGPIGSSCSMLFICWPMIAEVFTWV